MQNFIETSDGTTVLIDPEDFTELSKRKWRLKVSHGLRYAASTTQPFTLMHRAILRPKNGQLIDHINGDGLDNRRENLRLCTHAQNMANRSIHKNNKSGYKGVRWKRDKQKWCAEIRSGGKSIFLGYFDFRVDAAIAYDNAAIEIHGEFAKTNF